jgi:hypothetical protein
MTIHISHFDMSEKDGSIISDLVVRAMDPGIRLGQRFHRLSISLDIAA